MPESHQQVIARLESVVAELDDLAEGMTLVGGCLTPLLVTDPAAPPPRPTLDIDLVVELTTAAAYDRLGRDMRQRGFQLGLDPDDPICRFRKEALAIDLLPTSQDVLGFGNLWYPLAAATAGRIVLPSGRRLRHATAPCFLATKIAAFRDRGRGDYLSSRDFEDIVAVVDGRPELVTEMATAPDDLQTWVRAELSGMVRNRGFADSLYGMVPGHGDVAGRVAVVRDRFERLARP